MADDGSIEYKWVKAQRSAALNACVELARDGDLILLRDSKDPAIHLRFTPLEMDVFLDAVKKREFDDFSQAGI